MALRAVRVAAVDVCAMTAITRSVGEDWPEWFVSHPEHRCPSHVRLSSGANLVCHLRIYHDGNHKSVLRSHALDPVHVEWTMPPPSMAEWADSGRSTDV